MTNFLLISSINCGISQPDCRITLAIERKFSESFSVKKVIASPLRPALPVRPSMQLIILIIKILILIEFNLITDSVNIRNCRRGKVIIDD